MDRYHQLKTALNTITNDFSERQTAIKFSIPRSTLQKRRTNKNTSAFSSSRKLTFKIEVETELAEQIENLVIFLGLTLK